MSQITLRELDPGLERLIRRKAAEEGKSLNVVVQELLRKAVGLESGSPRQRNLSGLAGTWTQAEADSFDSTQQGFQQVDQEVWK